MTLPNSFSSSLPIGDLPLNEIQQILLEIGEKPVQSDGRASRLADASALSTILTRNRKWIRTSHVFGYIAPIQTLESINDVGKIEAGLSLKNSRVNIRLNAVRVADYPGWNLLGPGRNRILFDFFADHHGNQFDGRLHFSDVFEGLQGESVGVRGAPIFTGLGVGPGGIVFGCRTVSVNNSSDEALLSFFKSDVFRNGLNLIAGMHPVIELFSTMSQGIVDGVEKHSRKNQKVQEFIIGLDFEKTPGGARLAEGAYVIVQVPRELEASWNWGEWIYDWNRASIVSRHNQDKLIDWNYIVIGISKSN